MNTRFTQKIHIYTDNDLVDSFFTILLSNRRGGAAAARRGGGGGGLTNIDAATTFSSFENQSNSLSHNLVLGYQSMEDF